MDKLFVHWMVETAMGTGQLSVDEHHDMFNLLPDRLLRATSKCAHQIPRQNLRQGHRSQGIEQPYFWRSEEGRKIPEHYIVHKTPRTSHHALPNGKPTRHVLRVVLEEWEESEEPGDAEGQKESSDSEKYKNEHPGDPWQN